MGERVKLDNTRHLKPFSKGQGGRPKGAVNRTTKLLRECILQAAEELGRDGKGKEGMVGYLKKIGDKHPDLFVGLLGRVLPMQLVGTMPHESTVNVRLTLPQLEERLRERGLPLAFDPPLEVPFHRVTNGNAGGNGAA